MERSSSEDRRDTEMNDLTKNGRAAHHRNPSAAPTPQATQPLPASPTRKGDQLMAQKPAAGKFPTGPFDHPLPANNAVLSTWPPVEIILIYWTIDLYPDPTNPVVEIDFTKSGRYGSTYLTNGIFAFAQSVFDNGVGDAPLPLYVDPAPDPQSFVIKKPCYVVFALEQPPTSATTATQWQFWRNVPALTDSDTPDGKYSDLNHVVPDDGTPVQSSNNGTSGCQVAYFSAYAVPSTDFIVDHFNIFVEYVYNNQFASCRIDPAIKNKGHRTLTHPLAMAAMT
jgi:hypothetical protein